MADPVEPRSVPQIVSDLLQLVIDSQWSGQSRHGCHCHPSFAPCCPECEVEQYEHDDSRREHPNPHKADCTRQRLITETRAYLEVENKLAEEQDVYQEPVYVP